MTVLGRIFHQGCERQTSASAAVAGLVVGAGLGGLLTALGWVLLVLAADNIQTVAAVILVLPVALVFWFIGMFAVAAPGWWVLHQLGARCQQAAMMYGGGLTLVAGIGFFQTLADGTPMGPMLASLALFAIGGIIVGWVVGKIAYTPASAIPA